MTLRVAQELLARVLRASESTTLRVGVDGRDIVVTVDALDADDAPVQAELATDLAGVGQHRRRRANPRGDCADPRS